MLLQSHSLGKCISVESRSHVELLCSVYCPVSSIHTTISIIVVLVCNIQHEHILSVCLCTNLTKSRSCTFRRWFLDSKSPNGICFCPCAQDDTALLLLGQCYESGFGVQQNLKTAIELYKQAAQAGNRQAKSLLTPHSKGKPTCYAFVLVSAFFCICDCWHCLRFAFNEQRQQW